MNPFPYSDDNKRYHTLAYHNRHTYGKRIWKAVLDGGFSCPNLDGTCGTGGCVFCDGGSGYFTHAAAMPIPEQLEAELARIRKKDPDPRVIAYFQVHTNTYAPVERLRQVYEPALSHPAVMGLAIGTRPDCLPTDVLAYLEELSHRTNLTVELGLQTCMDDTARRINRGYPFSVFVDAMEQLHQRRIRTCVHLINGLPGETPVQMVESARQVGLLHPDAVKLQLLHVIRGTALADWYNAGRFSVMSQTEYVSVILRQLEVLPPETVIERITGDGDRNKLIAPLWSMRKIAVLSAIDKAQAQAGSWQGKALGAALHNACQVALP